MPVQRLMHFPDRQPRPLPVSFYLWLILNQARRRLVVTLHGADERHRARMAAESLTRAARRGEAAAARQAMTMWMLERGLPGEGSRPTLP